MPIYAFECGACGHQFDRLQRLSDADPTECPACAQAQIRRQLTAPQFRLAGGGWYETDFKKDGDKKRNLADSGDAPKSEAKPAEAKPESKPESKPAPKPAATPASGD
jgi:putative FmdB family regulatory protein